MKVSHYPSHVYSKIHNVDMMIYLNCLLLDTEWTTLAIVTSKRTKACQHAHVFRMCSTCWLVELIAVCVSVSFVLGIHICDTVSMVDTSQVCPTTAAVVASLRIFTGQ